MTEEKNKPFYIKFKPSLMEKVEDLIEVAKLKKLIVNVVIATAGVP